MHDAPLPRVSAIIPTFNGESFIVAAVESVLDQTYPSVECIVVDDGSTDRTVALVRGFGQRARLIAQPNEGPGAARNLGVGSATGSLLAFLDQDDVWDPDRLQRMVAAMESVGADASLCSARVLGTDPPMGRVMRMDPIAPTVDSLLLWRGTVVSCGSNLLIERRTFSALGGFDATLGAAADWELLVRLVAAGVEIAYVEEPLVTYRWHEGNATRDLAELERAVERAYSVILSRCPEGSRVSAWQAHGGMHKMLAVAALRMGDRRKALAHGIQAVPRNPRGMVISAGRALNRRVHPERCP